MRIFMKKRWLSLVLIYSLLIGTIVGVFLSEKVRADNSKVVYVGYYENEIFQEGARDGAVKTGYAYEYYRKLSEYTGWKYEYVYGTYNELYEQLLDGEIDLLAGLAKTPEREELISYPAMPMGTEIYHLIKHTYDTDVTNDPTSFSNKKIGILNSAIIDVFYNYVLEYDVDCNVIKYDDYESLLHDFDNGGIDIAAVEGSGTYSRTNSEVVGTFGSSDFYLCVNKDRPDLLEELDNAQTSITNQEPNFISNLKNKYYQGSVTSLSFSSSEKEWIENNDKLVVGYLENLLPLSDTDSNGNVTGIIKDIIPQILSNLSLSDIDVSYVGYASYEDMMQDISNEKIDIAFPVNDSLFYSEINEIYPSNSLLSVSNELVFKKNKDTSKVHTLAVNRNNGMQYYYTKSSYPNAEIIYYPDIESCLKAVKNGQVDATVLSSLRAYDILKNSKYNALSAIPLSLREDICFGVKIGNEGLLKLINRGVALFNPDYISSLTTHYTDKLYTYTFFDLVRDHIAIFIVISIAIFVMITTAVIISMRSKVEKARKQRRAIQKVFNQMIRAFAKIIDKKDEYTSGHSFRVANYSRRLALKIGYSTEKAEKVYNVALLHDIGKILIPNDILHKKDVLNEDEYNQVKKHPEYGNEILQEIDLIPEISYGAGYHHERFDGKGYPEGLKGDEIPEIAQIISVADAFDAMYSTRPYRKKMDLEECLNEIQEGAGSQFNPDFAQAFIELVKEGKLEKVEEENNDILWW
ncbi:HDIG domain-containing protein [Lachnospira multipara]|uniref:HDIG domain-containing protein n=2 Tax=Lachnospira multipara TaxID=28051 RepID=A0A1H5TX20_9FIRM|nr:HDIG domain-containing protein [Lachnospira multipara]